MNHKRRLSLQQDDARELRLPDGARLAYWIRGRGRPMLLLNGFVCSTHYWPIWIDHFSATNRQIIWDYRGYGLSPMPPILPESLAVCAEDAAALLTAEAQGPAVIIGHSMGAQVALDLYRLQDRKSVV